MTDSGKQYSAITVGGLEVTFQRTCRVPTGQMNSLPAALGAFPLYRVADHASGTPAEWHGEGWFMPVYRQEAMWLSFPRSGIPKALIVGAGNINAITGKPFDPSKEKGSRRKPGRLDIHLAGDVKDQNYLAIPPQPWLDGWKSDDGKVYQFVAAELGSGETVEGQITGEETAGGIQLIVFDPKPGLQLTPATRPHEYLSGGSFGGGHSYGGGDLFSMGGASKSMSFGSPMRELSRSPTVGAVSMGLGRGGEIRQKVYPDPYGHGVWNEKPTAVDLVYMVRAEDFRQITGRDAPPSPVTYQTYQQHGLPWFDLHDQALPDTAGSGVFANLKPVSGDPPKAGSAVPIPGASLGKLVPTTDRKSTKKK